MFFWALFAELPFPHLYASWPAMAKLVEIGRNIRAGNWMHMASNPAKLQTWKLRGVLGGCGCLSRRKPAEGDLARDM